MSVENTIHQVKIIILLGATDSPISSRVNSTIVGTKSEPPVSGECGMAWTNETGRAEPRPDGTGLRRTKEHVLSTVRYLFNPEAHVYASSIAANVLLSFFPFTLIIITVCRRGLQWDRAFQVALQLLRANLPAGADFVVRNLVVLAQGHRRLQVMSVAVLLFTSSGIFLPLESALNKVWSIEQNRTYLHNQAVSFLLTLTFSLMALSSILLIAGCQWLVGVPAGWTPVDGVAAVIWRGLLEAVLFPCTVGVYFLMYYVLPNGNVPAGPVFSAAFAVGLVTEGGKFVYHVTLPLFKFREVYGPFALSVTLLFWAFLGALVLLSGAHLSARLYFRDRVGPGPVRGKAAGLKAGAI
jgi:YihY family inner membrane protein